MINKNFLGRFCFSFIVQIIHLVVSIIKPQGYKRKLSFYFFSCNCNKSSFSSWGENFSFLMWMWRTFFYVREKTTRKVKKPLVLYVTTYLISNFFVGKWKKRDQWKFLLSGTILCFDAQPLSNRLAVLFWLLIWHGASTLEFDYDLREIYLNFGRTLA